MSNWFWRITVYEPFVHTFDADDVSVKDSGALLIVQNGYNSIILGPAIKYRADRIMREQEEETYE